MCETVGNECLNRTSVVGGKKMERQSLLDRVLLYKITCNLIRIFKQSKLPSCISVDFWKQINSLNVSELQVA